MKKIFMVLSLIGMFTFIAPKVATSAEYDCRSHTIICPDGSQHYAVVCGDVDWFSWGELLCGISYH